MKLVDLAFIVNPNCKVIINVHSRDINKDDKMIGPVEFMKVGYGGYEVTDITVDNEGYLLITCYDR